MATDPQKNKDMEEQAEEIAGGKNLTDEQLKRLAAAGGSLETNLKRADLDKIAGGKLDPRRTEEGLNSAIS